MQRTMSNQINPLTIDNLGIEASNRYAKDQAGLDLNLIRDARRIPDQTLRVVMNPSVALSREFSIGNHILWANFSPPKDYSFSAFRLFTYQLIPGLGTLDQTQALLDQMERLAPQMEEKDAAQKKAFRALLLLLQMLEKLEKTFEFLKANRDRYQQG